MRFSEPEHVVEAEALVAVHEAVEAEEAAGGVADDDVAAASHALAFFCGEGFRQAPVIRAATGNLDLLFGDRLSFCVMQDEQGGAFRVPFGRGRIDEVTESIECALFKRRSRDAQEEARRQPRRLVGVTLRLVLVDDGGVVDMGAEDCFRAVAA